jgi:cell wall-associated NlpC family hydrolase
VQRSPHGRHSDRQTQASIARARPRMTVAVGRAAAAMSIAAAIGLALPGSAAGAAGSSPAPSLKALLAKAAKLSNQIDELGQQYDALRISLAEAKAQVKIAHLTVRRDERLLAAEEAAAGRIAAAGYMTGGMSPTLQLLESSDPQAILGRASILNELQRQNGAKLSLVAAARAAATRANLLAVQESRQAASLSAAMQREVSRIQAKENVLNSAAYAQALAIYDQTGHFPVVAVHGNSIEVQALREALTKVGDPYVWGAAGPSAFDCSGLVVWAYAQLGISLMHYTGDLWNEGMHVSRSQLQPGDLVFFFPDIGHVGIYMGGGMMVDAPTYGIPVHVEPVYWSAYVGAVRIA